MIIQNNGSKLSKSIGAYLAANVGSPVKLLNIQTDIYKIQFLHQTETRYLFHASAMNHAIVSFINEYAAKYQIYIYHDIEYAHQVPDQCYNIIPYNKALNINNIIPIGHIINNISFYPISDKNSDQMVACTFWNNRYPVSETLYRLCDTKDVIIFDSTHPSVYNLGITTEEEKNTILNNCKTYIDITNEYGPEAAMLGCDVLYINAAGSLEPASYQNSIDIKHFISDILKV